MLFLKGGSDALAPPTTYKSSMFNVLAPTPDGGLMIVNTLSESKIAVSKDSSEVFRSLLSRGEIAPPDLEPELRNELVRLGMLVEAQCVESRKLRHLQTQSSATSRTQHLIVLPTEKCNFRCDYCYESFEIGKMKPAKRMALRQYLRSRIPHLDVLKIDWFGGEPLLALDVMGEILDEANELSEAHGCKLSGHITTNGYYLSQEVAAKLLAWRIDSFQITLDGPANEHDRRRLLYVPRGSEDVAQKGTFDVVMRNIESLLAIRGLFNLQIRTNYDLDSLPAMDTWIDELVVRFGDDPRVRLDFCPIWADPCRVDVSIPIGPEKQRTYVDLMRRAQRAGLRTNAERHLSFGNLVCYAAKPESMVVRANGDIVKCTVAFDLEENKVGQLLDDGSLSLNLDRLAVWTNSGMDEDTTCQSCAMSPTCQGNACPLERIVNHKRPCPPPKSFPEDAVYLGQV